MQRRRTTSWVTTDGTAFSDREAAYRHEKILLVASFIAERSGLHPHEAEGLATSLVDAKDQGFQFILLPHRKGDQT
jgi:hypothetical protein